MSDIKVSDKLLSLVLGCDCKSVELEIWDLEIEIEYKEINNNMDVIDRTLNLDTFVRLAKIKAFECGYDIIEYSNSVKILSIKTFYPKVNYNRFTIELIIEALEWVAEEVGGEG